MVRNPIIEVYTDGSCHTQLKIGGWAALLFINDSKIVLQGSADNTTHNRMELIAVIKAIEYVLKNLPEIKIIKIFTDSQYVEQIPFRATKLLSKDFKTKAGNELQNTDLIKELIQLINSTNIEFIKVKAHQKAADIPNYNRVVDKLSRKIVRKQIGKMNR